MNQEPIALTVASGQDLEWAKRMVRLNHYLRKSPDQRSRPMAYVARCAGELVGCLWFGRPESTKCFAGKLTYGGAPDVANGRAAWDRWEVLNLSRLWLSPDVQIGGRLCRPGLVPGFTDRHGSWRPAMASATIGLTLAVVGFDYLAAHPPCFLDQPYRIRVVLSYCDTRLHRGAVYRAAGFRLARTNAQAIETWFTTKVADITEAADARVRRAAEASHRSRRIRARADRARQAVLFGGD